MSPKIVCPPDSLAELRVALRRGREGRGKEREGERKEIEWWVRREGKGYPRTKSWLRPVYNGAFFALEALAIMRYVNARFTLHYIIHPYILAVKAKFHYAIWFEACSELVRSWFEPDSVMEFGFKRHVCTRHICTSSVHIGLTPSFQNLRSTLLWSVVYLFFKFYEKKHCHRQPVGIRCAIITRCKWDNNLVRFVEPGTLLSARPCTEVQSASGQLQRSVRWTTSSTWCTVTVKQATKQIS